MFFKAGQENLSVTHALLDRALPNLQCASSLYINQTSSKVRMLAPPQRSMLLCFVSSDASNVSPWTITLLPYSVGGHGHGYLLLALYIQICVFGEPDAQTSVCHFDV